MESAETDPEALATVIDRIENGHHVFRAYWKNALLKQYEKFSRFPHIEPDISMALLSNLAGSV